MDKPARQQGTRAWVKAHQTPLAIAAVGGAALLLYLRSRSAASASGSGSGSGSAAGSGSAVATPVYYSGGSGGGGGGSDGDYATLESQIAGIRSQLHSSSHQQDWRLNRLRTAVNRRELKGGPESGGKRHGPPHPRRRHHRRRRYGKG